MNLLISSNLHEINPFKFWEKLKFFILTCYNNSIYKTWKQPSRTWPARQVQRTRSFFWQGYKGLLQYSVGAVFVLSLFFSFFFFLGLACEAVLYYRIQRIATVQRYFFFGLRTPLDSTKKSQTRFPLNSYYNYKRDFFFFWWEKWEKIKILQPHISTLHKTRCYLSKGGFMIRDKNQALIYKTIFRGNSWVAKGSKVSQNACCQYSESIVARKYATGSFSCPSNLNQSNIPHWASPIVNSPNKNIKLPQH